MVANIQCDPGRDFYIKVLRRMSPEAKLRKTFELYEFARECFMHGLRERFPHATDEEIREIYLERIGECYNRNY